MNQRKFFIAFSLDLLQKSIFNRAPGGVPAAEDGDESTYARSLLKNMFPTDLSDFHGVALPEKRRKSKPDRSLVSILCFTSQDHQCQTDGFASLFKAVLTYILDGIKRGSSRILAASPSYTDLRRFLRAFPQAVIIK